MTPEENLVELIGRDPDERLLSEDLAQLPETVGRPEVLPESAARKRLVGIGATLTGVTLVGGMVLIVLGIVLAVSSGLGAAAIAALVAGGVLVSTHWGWVHVAEISANSLDNRRNSDLLTRRRRWLSTIEPYSRWEVSTTAGADGSITIVTVRHQPVPLGGHGFTFAREIVARELHSGEEPAATVAEHAELLRRQAALDTERERERYEAANDAYQGALLAHADDQERLAAVRAASEALSERINTNLRDPPLTE
jgi:hypothetical protein